jgi:hypothetical protein
MGSNGGNAKRRQLTTIDCDSIGDNCKSSCTFFSFCSDGMPSDSNGQCQDGLAASNFFKNPACTCEINAQNVHCFPNKNACDADCTKNCDFEVDMCTDGTDDQPPDSSTGRCNDGFVPMSFVKVQKGNEVCGPTCDLSPLNFMCYDTFNCYGAIGKMCEECMDEIPTEDGSTTIRSWNDNRVGCAKDTNAATCYIFKEQGCLDCACWGTGASGGNRRRRMLREMEHRARSGEFATVEELVFNVTSHHMFRRSLGWGKGGACR